MCITGSPIHYPVQTSPNRFVEGSTTLSQHLQRLQLHQNDLYPATTGAQGEGLCSDFTGSD